MEPTPSENKILNYLLDSIKDKHIQPRTQNKIIDKLGEIIKETVDKETESRRKCVICWSEPPNQIFIPCGHICICTQCSISMCRIVVRCPICRDYGRCYKVFYSGQESTNQTEVSSNDTIYPNLIIRENSDEDN